MKKPDPSAVRIFEAKIKAWFDDLQRLYKQGKLKAAAGLMADRTALVLLKSQNYYRGKVQIYAFLQALRRRGVREIKMTVKQSRIRPIDMLIAEDSAKGRYWAYDLQKSLLGIYEFKNPNRAVFKGKFFIAIDHIEVCDPEPGFIIFEF
jgi:hypothetical protein